MSAEFVVRKEYRSDRRNAVRYIWSHVRRHPWIGLGMIIGAFSNAALFSAVPVFIGQGRQRGY